MKILHTADLHLRDGADDRWQALEHALDAAREHEVRLVVISGDLFDSPRDVERLRVPVRELFEAHPFDIVIIPGNHDAGAIRAGDYYGANVTLLEEPGSFKDVEDVRVFGLPYEPVTGEAVLERLQRVRRHIRPQGCHVLLYHGELIDALFDRDDFGEEEQTAYMPVRLSYFEDSGIDYVLAGHFHSRFDVRRFGSGFFVYPGSPVSVTRKEAGRRHANLFETGGPPRAVPLDTLHYVSITERLSPGDDERRLEELATRLDTCHPRARVELVIEGLVDLARSGQSESEYAAEIQERFGPRVHSVTSRWIDVGDVLRNEIFVRCATILEGLEAPDDEKDRVRTLLMESIAEARHAH